MVPSNLTHTVISVSPFCQVKACLPSLICSYSQAQTLAFNSPALLSPRAHYPLSSQVPVLSRSNPKPSHLLTSPQHPLPGPTPYLELPHIPFSELSEIPTPSTIHNCIFFGFSFSSAVYLKSHSEQLKPETLFCWNVIVVF